MNQQSGKSWRAGRRPPPSLLPSCSVVFCRVLSCSVVFCRGIGFQPVIQRRQAESLSHTRTGDRRGAHPVHCSDYCQCEAASRPHRKSPCVHPKNRWDTTPRDSIIHCPHAKARRGRDRILARPLLRASTPSREAPRPFCGTAPAISHQLPWRTHQVTQDHTTELTIPDDDRVQCTAHPAR